MMQQTITKTCPCNIQRFFFKIENFQLKIFDIFLIFAQNIDCGYTLEPPRRGGSNEYPQIMFGAKIRKIGIHLHAPVRTCFPDVLGEAVLTSTHKLCFGAKIRKLDRYTPACPSTDMFS